MIYHICTEQEWQKSILSETYYPISYEKEKFIHCSTAKQIERIANTHYINESSIFLLFINDESEKTYIKFENLEGGNELFPHIYRKLPKLSILKIEKISKNNLNIFQLNLDKYGLNNDNI